MIKISYDYYELLQELKEEVSDGILSLTDTIQILRDTKEIEGYRPIINWYYSESEMMELLQIDIFDNESEIIEKRTMAKQYQIDRPYLKTILVGSCILEMEERSRII